jgi:hypothetical protein
VSASAKIVWAKGGEATVVALVADAITLRSSDGDPVRVKVHSSKRQEDGSFVIEGRALDMTRVVREKIAPPQA